MSARAAQWHTSASQLCAASVEPNLALLVLGQQSKSSKVSPPPVPPLLARQECLSRRMLIGCDFYSQGHGLNPKVIIRSTCILPIAVAWGGRYKRVVLCASGRWHIAITIVTMRTHWRMQRSRSPTACGLLSRIQNGLARGCPIASGWRDFSNVVERQACGAAGTDVSATMRAGTRVATEEVASPGSREDARA